MRGIRPIVASSGSAACAVGEVSRRRATGVRMVLGLAGSMMACGEGGWVDFAG